MLYFDYWFIRTFVWFGVNMAFWDTFEPILLVLHLLLLLPVLFSGSASVGKEPGYPDAFFFSKKVDDLFISRRSQNTKAANAAEIVSLSK